MVKTVHDSQRGREIPPVTSRTAGRGETQVQLLSVPRGSLHTEVLVVVGLARVEVDLDDVLLHHPGQDRGLGACAR